MKNLATRFLSAFVALALVFSLAYYTGALGLKILTILIVTYGIRELKRIFFVRWSWMFFAALIFPITWALELFIPDIDPMRAMVYEFVFLSLFFLCTGVFLGRKRSSLSEVFSFESKSILGSFYIGFLPWFAVHLLDIKNGVIWFFGLLSVVFLGDTFAYFSGRFWGAKKIMPSISPKKTFAGAWGGVFGSTIAAVVFYFLMPDVPIWVWLLLGPIAGAIAQIGDFSESLFKRVAEVKDSGTLMPGHGGVLDRIDGVLFAGPVFYFVARFFA